ncbi:MAG: hypothetical protein JSS02_19315, partial [Planctomycetes bacterium]|nr:hypothetical protein [Planctomycetota bacterium]
VAIGVALTYSVIAGFVNRTVIEVTHGLLTVWHGPIPWRGNQTLRVDDIDQLYCALKGGKGRKAPGSAVHVLYKDGRQQELCSVLSSIDEARYVVRTIEEYLGLVHQPVAGEIP